MSITKQHTQHTPHPTQMEEVRIRDEQVQKSLTQINELIDGLKKSKRQPSDILMIEDLLKTARDSLDAMEIEIPRQSETNKKLYRTKFKQHKSDLAQADNELQWFKSDANKKELLEGATVVNVRDLESETGLINYGLELDQKSTTSLQNTAGVVAKTLEVGKQTANTLQKQTEQIASILNGLDTIDDTMTRAQRILGRIGRRVMTDKYVWVFMFLIVAAILFIVIYPRVHSSGGGSSIITPPAGGSTGSGG